MKNKIKITIGDLREVWYIMECPCDFEEFVQSYLEDDEYEVINDWKVSYIDNDSCYEY